MQRETTNILGNIVPISEAPNKIPFAEKTLRNWRFQGKYSQIFIKFGGKVFVNLDECKKILDLKKEKAIKQAKRLGLDD